MIYNTTSLFQLSNLPSASQPEALNILIPGKVQEFGKNDHDLRLENLKYEIVKNKKL